MPEIYAGECAVKESINTYARIGLVHHMLYPESNSNPEAHFKTLMDFIKRNDIETFDCCLPYDKDKRKLLAEAIRNCGKTDIVFAIHFFPFKKFHLASPAYLEQSQVRLIIEDMIQQAIMIGATGFIFGSGGPSAEEATAEHYRSFGSFCKWLCGQLKPHGITAMLEPFDTAIDKKFLYGSTEKCIELIHSLRPEVDNLAIELDLAHVPLMGESFSHAIKTIAPHLKRVHLGNCVLKDKNHPRYGDTHPPIGFDGGEIDIPELIEILRCFLDIGFLNKNKRGSLLIEMTPWPGRTVDQTVTDTLNRLQQAWAAI
jgi:sugar phosphate isomerase/epimerase